MGWDGRTVCTLEMGSMGDCGECASVDVVVGEMGAILRPPVLSDGFALVVLPLGTAVDR